MAEADAFLLEALLDDVVGPTMLKDGIESALRLLRRDSAPDQKASIDRDPSRLRAERARRVRAIAPSGELEDRVAALQDRDDQCRALEQERWNLRERPCITLMELGRTRRELTARPAEWCDVLANAPDKARPIVSSLLVGRATFTLLSRRREWELQGDGTMSGLFRAIVSVGVASPTGTAKGCTCRFTGIAA